MEFLQGTSAQVERGSSGGPLVNEHGAVVGVMTMRRDTSSGEAARLSFAVKASSTRKARDGPAYPHSAPSQFTARA